MLGDICPAGCHTPLMRSRDKTQLLCCSCGTDFMSQSSTNIPLVENARPVVEVEVAVTTATDESLAYGSLKAAVGDKIAWVAKLIQTCSNPSELFQLISLSDQLLSLHKRLHGN